MKNEKEKEITNEEISEILNDLYLFYRVFVASEYSDDVHAPHIDDLSIELTKLTLNEYDRLCVALAPRHSKSSMVTLAYPLWLILQNPNQNILIVNNSGNLSETFGIRLRELFKKYSEPFGIKLSDVKHSSTYLMFENLNGELYNGSIRLVGAGGSITGQDADYVIIDDPYKGFEDITPTLLEKKIEWFKTIILQRLEINSKLVICHTRWHTNDIQGYLKENFPDQYTFIEYPAIQEDGTPLWRERYTLEHLQQKQKEMGEFLFSSIYQQKPLDDTSTFFNTNLIHYYTPKDYEPYLHVRSWDIASGDETQKSDYTSGVYWSIDTQGRLLFTDIVYGRFGDETGNKILETAELDTPNTDITIETGVAAAGKLLYHEWEKILKGYSLNQSEPVGTKTDRATPLRNSILQGKVYIDIKDNELRGKILKEFKSFPLGIHDDIVDSCSYAHNYLTDPNNNPAPVLTFIEL